MAAESFQFVASGIVSSNLRDFSDLAEKLGLKT